MNPDAAPATGLGSGLASATVVPATDENIAAAATRLAAGGLVAFPTETVYGLGADASSPAAVAAVYATKGRPADHPLIVHVADAQAARFWADLPEAAQRLAGAFWPGPLTLILLRRPQAPAHACGGEDTVGLRCPSHPVAHALLARFLALGGMGVAAPSANRFGRVSPTRAQHVLDDLGDAAPPVLDGGDADVGIESTIVDLSRGAPVLLRPGAIDTDALSRAAGMPVALGANVVDPSVRDASAPRASGTLASHYAPRTPLVIATGAVAFAEAVVAHAGTGARVAAWAFEDGLAALAGKGFDAHRRAGAVAGGTDGDGTDGDGTDVVAGHTIRVAPAQPRAYARSLYATLRELDAAGCDRIVLQAPPRGPAWQAVGDRLARAAMPG